MVCWCGAPSASFLFAMLILPSHQQQAPASTEVDLLDLRINRTSVGLRLSDASGFPVVVHAASKLGAGDILVRVDGTFVLRKELKEVQQLLNGSSPSISLQVLRTASAYHHASVIVDSYVQAMKYYQQGTQLYAEQRASDAILAFKNAYKIMPKNTDVAYNLGMTMTIDVRTGARVINREVYSEGAAVLELAT